MRRRTKRSFFWPLALPFLGSLALLGCPGNRPIAPGTPATATPTPAGGGMGKILISHIEGVDTQIYAMNSDGSGVTQLTHGPGNNWNATYSWDGSKVAFSSSRDGTVEVYIMDPDGSGQTRVTNSAQFSLFPAWSPDGSKIAFVRSSGTPVSPISTPATPDDLMTIQPNGSGETNLTLRIATPSPTPGPNYWNAIRSFAWSPNGSEILFISETIYKMDADGLGLTQLVPYPPAHPAIDPSWSPLGTEVAVTEFSSPYPDLYLMDPTATSFTQLTDNSSTHYQDLFPCWSPDGSRIAFTRYDSGPTQVFSMKADGSDLVQLTFPTGSSWTHDGCWR